MGFSTTNGNNNTGYFANTGRIKMEQQPKTIQTTKQQQTTLFDGCDNSDYKPLSPGLDVE